MRRRLEVKLVGSIVISVDGEATDQSYEFGTFGHWTRTANNFLNAAAGDGNPKMQQVKIMR